MKTQNRSLNLSPFTLCICSFILGAPAVFSFAPYNFWYLIFASITGLLFLLHDQNPKQSFNMGFCWGLGFFGLGIRWVYVSMQLYGGMPIVVNLFLIGLLIAYLALFPGLFAWLLNKPSSFKDGIRYCIWAPVIWLLVEWLRGVLFTGFPWLELGYSQIYSPLSNIAPIFAVDGITFIIVLICGFFVLYVRSKQILYLIFIALITISTIALRHINWVSPSTKPPVKVAVIQENVNQVDKWLPQFVMPTIDSYFQDSSNYWSADLIVWPETAIPASAQNSIIASYLDLIDQTAKKHHTAIISGIVNSKESNEYNSVIALGVGRPDPYKREEDKMYNKYHLLPFGEFVPFGNILRKFAPFFNLPYSSFTPGKKRQPNIKANGYNIAPAICFEILFNEEVRRNITPITDILLTVSNDAWFGDSDGPRQHLEIAQMRALEFSKPLIRATNSGISALIDSKGMIVHELGVMKKGSFMDLLPLTTGTTPYYSWGKKPLYFLIILFIIIAIFSKKRSYHRDLEIETGSWGRRNRRTNHRR